MSWITRGGKTSAFSAARMDWLSLAFSPDGRQLAVEVTEGARRDIVIHDLEGDTTRRLTSAPTDEMSPIWSQDGRRIVYTSTTPGGVGKSSLFWQRADGAGEPVRLLDADRLLLAGSCSTTLSDSAMWLSHTGGDLTDGWQ